MLVRLILANCTSTYRENLTRTRAGHWLAAKLSQHLMLHLTRKERAAVSKGLKLAHVAAARDRPLDILLRHPKRPHHQIQWERDAEIDDKDLKVHATRCQRPANRFVEVGFCAQLTVSVEDGLAVKMHDGNNEDCRQLSLHLAPLWSAVIPVLASQPRPCAKSSMFLENIKPPRIPEVTAESTA